MPQLSEKAFHAIYGATMRLLPERMASAESKALLYAIGLQESRFEHRRQIRGPARGFWQFEQGGGVRGVLTHAATKPHIEAVLTQLGYDSHVLTSYNAIVDNDILACAFARLNLWWSPHHLPKCGEHQRAWEYYMFTWRPGKPHRHTWDQFYAQGWDVV